MNTYATHTKAKIITTFVTVVVIIGVVVLIEILQNNAKVTKSTALTSSTSSATTVSGTNSTSSSTYKDGTYTSDASYYVPHGQEDIKVTLTISNGVVTNSTIVNSESDHDSQRYQEEFAAEYKTYVVGKNLADIKLSYVAGASDTTDGFNDALTQIRSQAQA